jgi:hypothetical protein
LLDWLDEAAEATPTRLVRLPVVLRFHPLYHGITSAVIGVTADENTGSEGSTEGPGDPEDAPIRLTLNDGAMGMPLARRAAEYRGVEQDTCAVWIDGHWGLPGDAFPQEAEPEQDGTIRALFSPVDVADAVTPGQQPHQVHAQIEEKKRPTPPSAR